MEKRAKPQIDKIKMSHSLQKSIGDEISTIKGQISHYILLPIKDTYIPFF